MAIRTCGMCEDAPPTTDWGGIKVCQSCHDFLSALEANLKEEEANDPTLAELGRRVEEAFREFP